MMDLLFSNKHNVIVMDGTDRANLWGVIGKISEFLKSKDTIQVSQLDKAHPSMMVIQYKIGRSENQKVQEMLDDTYPGLCAYDAVV